MFQNGLDISTNDICFELNESWMLSLHTWDNSQRYRLLNYFGVHSSHVYVLDTFIIVYWRNICVPNIILYAYSPGLNIHQLRPLCQINTNCPR